MLLSERINLILLTTFTVFIILLVTVFTIIIAFASDEFSYPETMSNLQSYSNSYSHLQLLLISDDDALTKYDNTYYSRIYLGVLNTPTSESWTYNPSSTFSVTTKYNEKKRGNENSAVVYYNDKMYVFDDKTGIASELDISHTSIYPRMIYNKGNGNSSNGMKCEWATVKDEVMFIGSHGNSRDEDDLYKNSYVQKVNNQLVNEPVNWYKYFEKINDALGIKSPGYVTHEAITWSNYYEKWVIFPRKVSQDAYDEITDMTSSSKVMLICDEDFEQCETIKDPQYVNERCFSSVRLAPFNEKIMIYTKSVENEGKIESYIGVIDTGDIDKEGYPKILLHDTYVGPYKVEGLEILSRK
ncbi:Apyrase [Entamoeba marina]